MGIACPARRVFAPFTEYWSFLRRRSTIPGKPGLMEGHCPNCGAPIEMNESANCTNCHALLRSGQYDWVLSEITQQSEWQTAGGLHRDPSAFDAIRQRDPGFNIQALEDRASVIFWRRAEAWRLGKVAPLQKAALPAFTADFAQSLLPPTNGARANTSPSAPWARSEPSALSPRTMIKPATAPCFGSYGLRRRWLIRPDGKPAPVSGEFLTFRTLMVLFRKPGVKTDASLAVSSAHCPNCGAPETDSASNACEFCGTVLNDGSVSWVLMSTYSQASGEGQQILQQLAMTAASPIAI